MCDLRARLQHSSESASALVIGDLAAIKEIYAVYQMRLA